MNILQMIALLYKKRFLVCAKPRKLGRGAKRLSLIFWASRKPKIVFYKEALSFEVYSQYSQ
ncbi:MAG: hypothetical protein ACK470_22440, partial [Pseudanabaena sp.]